MRRAELRERTVSMGAPGLVNRVENVVSELFGERYR